MAIKRPYFQRIPASNITDVADDLIAKVKSTQNDEGTSRVADLKEAAHGSKVSDEFIKILQTFESYYLDPADVPKDADSRALSVGGGGTSYRALPKTLDRNQVNSVLDVLLSAKTQLDKVDQNGDGEVSLNEIKSAELGGGGGFSGDMYLIFDALVKSAVQNQAELPDYKQKLRSFRAEQTRASEVERSRSGRASTDGVLCRLAAHHSASPEGEQALLWTYRARLVEMDVDPSSSKQNNNYRHLEKSAQKAETSFWRHFSRIENAPGHLDDEEIKSWLSTKDLAGFTESKKAAALDAVGGDWDAWVSGLGPED